MATTLTAPIHANKPIEVNFTNDDTSTGVVLIKAGWVPKQGHPLPDIPSVVVAPNATDGFKTRVQPFEAARRLSITVSLDEGESGLLQVIVDSAPHTTRVVKETTTFEMLVIP